MADATYQPAIYRKQGGNELVVASSGDITVESGGDINLESGGEINVAAGGLLTLSAGALLTFPVLNTTANTTVSVNTMVTVNCTTRVTVTLPVPTVGALIGVSVIGVSTANAINSVQVALATTNLVFGTSDRLINLPNKHDHALLVGISTAAWGIFSLGGSGLAGSTILVST